MMADDNHNNLTISPPTSVTSANRTLFQQGVLARKRAEAMNVSG